MRTKEPRRPGRRRHGEEDRQRAAAWGELVRAIRQARGISQEALGQELGLRQSSVSWWEQGRRSPSYLAGRELLRQARQHLGEEWSGRILALAGRGDFSAAR